MKIVLAAIAALFLAIVGIGVVSYISAYNTGNRLEQQIVATYDDNRNILAQYGNAIAEAAQIPEMQRDDLTKVVTAALEGRYGADGSKAVFQMIQEQNPQIDSSVYTKLQQMIEAGRARFEMSQTRLIDQKRIYTTHLGSFWKGMWMNIAGYPKIDLAKFEIVSSERANAAFDTKLEAPIKLR